METPGNTVRLLMRLGYWAVWHGLYTEAAALFRGAQAARPTSDVPVIGMAVLAMAMGKPESAVDLLKTEVAAGRSSAQVQAHLGYALRLAGAEMEGAELLHRVAQGDSDAQARQMASNLLSLEADQLQPKLAKIL